MITLQSGETDKIIVTDTIPTSPPTPPDPNPDSEKIVGKIIVTKNGLNSPIEDEIIIIKRNMLGTSVDVFIPETDIEFAYIDSFTVTPSTVKVTQIMYNLLSVEIPTEVLEEDIELNVTLSY